MKAGLVASGNLPRRRLRLLCDARGHSLEGVVGASFASPPPHPIGAGAPVPSLNTERRPSRHHGAADEGHAMMARGLPRSPRPDLGPAPPSLRPPSFVLPAPPPLLSRLR